MQGQLSCTDSSRVMGKKMDLWPLWLLELCRERGFGKLLMMRLEIEL